MMSRQAPAPVSPKVMIDSNDDTMFIRKHFQRLCSEYKTAFVSFEMFVLSEEVEGLLDACTRSELEEIWVRVAGSMVERVNLDGFMKVSNIIEGLFEPLGDGGCQGNARDDDVTGSRLASSGSVGALESEAPNINVGTDTDSNSSEEEHVIQNECAIA